jgi:hypothetical protein
MIALRDEDVLREMRSFRLKMDASLESILGQDRPVGGFLALLQIATEMMVDQRIEMLKNNKEYSKQFLLEDLQNGLEQAGNIFTVFIEQAVEKRFAA